MNVYLSGARLPSTYQEVEYIQSSGTQYIDTGYVLTSNPGYEIDFEFIGGDSDFWIPLLGVRNNQVGDSSYFCLYIQSSSLYVTPNYAGFDPGTSSGLTISKNTKYNIKENAGQFYLDGVYKSGCSTTNTYSSPTPKQLYLFANNNGNSGLQLRGNRMKLYGFKLYDKGTTIVRNFVPCYRKSDSVIGLYDLVNNQFYTNQGTGTFSKGNDVNMTVLKNAYIGEYGWKPGSNTLAYFPFTDDLNDHSSNQTSTKGGTVSIVTLDGVKCANFNSGYLTFPSKKWFNTNWTVSLFVKNPNNTTSGTSSIFLTSGLAGAGTEYVFLWNVIDSPYYINSSTYGSSRNNYVRYGYTKPSGWTHIVATQQGLIGKLYVNGTLVATNSSFSDNNITANTLYIGNNTDEPSDSKWWLKAYLSELIIENTAWDTTKVAHYYNITKGNYGL